MEVLDHDYTVYTEQAEADRNLLVKFYPMPIQNDDKSADAGRPIFDDVVMIEIRVRGNKDSVVLRPVRPDDKARFRDAWRHYEAGEGELNVGTPLKQWPALAASQVEELKYLGFRTVEQLAEASDAVVGRVPGMQTLKNKANAFMQLAKGVAPIEKMQKQLDEKSNELETTKRQLTEVAMRLAALEAERPTKGESKAPEKAAQAAPVPKRA